MPVPKLDESCVGLHAVVAVGYSNSDQHVTVLNSWGLGWGEEGYFYMPYHVITDSRICFDFWKVDFACQEGKPLPKRSHSLSALRYHHWTLGMAIHSPPSSPPPPVVVLGAGAAVAVEVAGGDMYLKATIISGYKI